MSSLTISDLSEEALRGLEQRAAKAGRSTSDEARLALESQFLRRRRFDPDDAKAAAEELRELARAANGGRLPRGRVEAFLADKRAEVALEEARFAESMARQHEWGVT